VTRREGVRGLAVGLAAALSACGHGARRPAGAATPITLRFWAFGREGEVVQQLIPEFERTHPAIRVRLQQIPFTAAHEKLLTAVVGEAAPDVAQLGNTWIPELVALRALLPLDSLVRRSPVVVPEDYFPGIWDTNRLGDTTYGVPWYVDTRVLFYRSDMLADAGYRSPPATWSTWRAAMARIRARSGGRTYGVLLPVNEWAQPIALGLAAGAPLLRDGDRYGDFTEPRFRAAFTFYIDLYRDSLSAPVSNTQVANRYQAFAAGEFAMFISGPWDVGECLRRLPDSLRGRWMTAPMPAADAVPDVPATLPLRGATDTTVPGASLAGGSSLVIFRDSPHPAAAWAFLEYLSAPAQQAAFYRVSEDLPARRSAWEDPSIARNPYVRAFGRQLQSVRPTPPVPEWEQIATLVATHGEAAARGAVTPDAALSALDADVDRALEKRRWLLARQGAGATGTGR